MDIKEGQKNWRGRELHLVYAGLTTEKREQEWSFCSHGLSLFQSLCPLLCVNRSDFLSLRLILRCFTWENAGICFFVCSFFVKTMDLAHIWQERANQFDFKEI